MATLIERVEATASQGLVDRDTWEALPYLLKITRAAEADHELDRLAGEPCPGCPVCAILDTSPLFREAPDRTLRVPDGEVQP